MRLGPTLFLRCINDTCNHLFKSRSYLSGNTYGSRVYSDSKVSSPMLPKETDYSKCPNCGVFARNEDLKQRIEREEYLFLVEDDPSDSDQNVSYLVDLTIDEYVELLQKTDFIEDKEEEIHIRFLLMFKFNDRIRNRKRIFNNQYERGIHEENLVFLIENLDTSIEENKLLKAEFLRNLRRFDESLAILETIKDEDIDFVVNQIKNKCEIKSYLTFELILPDE